MLTNYYNFCNILFEFFTFRYKPDYNDHNSDDDNMDTNYQNQDLDANECQELDYNYQKLDDSYNIIKYIER